MRGLVLCLLLFIAVPALALLPSPYIGGNVQVNSPTGNFSKTDIADEQGGAKTGMGGEIDLGITGGGGSIYAGYRFGKHSAEATYETPGGPAKIEGDWNINRWVLGARWHILGSTPIPIVPTVGGGVTLGKTESTAKGSAGGQTYDAAETSSNKMGWFLEAGALLKPPGPFSVIGDIQYHSFDAEFNSDVYDGTVKVSFFTFQLGLRYAFLPI